MTRRRLFHVTLAVMAVYTVALLAGVLLRVYDRPPDWLIYETYKDLLPLVIAIPAAYLAFAFQRRGAYAEALREYWSSLVRTIRGACAYTRLAAPTEEQYLGVLRELSIAIDEARGVFKNLPVPGRPDGWYPFEPVKEIHDDLRDVGFGPAVTPEQLAALRGRIEARWKLVRDEMLREFDRDVPTHHYTWYTNLAGPGPGPGDDADGSPEPDGRRPSG